MNPFYMKFFVTTTIPETLIFYAGQMGMWNKHFEVCAISSKEQMLKQFGREVGVRTEFIDMAREPSPLKDAKSLWRFIKLFRKERPEIVHGGTPKASMLSMLAAWITRRPIRIYMCHGLRFEAFSGFKRKFLIFMEWLTCRCATDVICVSFGARNGLVATGACPNKKARVVGHGSPCGINLSRYSQPSDFQKDSFRKSINIAPCDFVFIFIGRIVRDKGVNELISAFNRLHARYNDVQLIVLGQFNDYNAVDESTRHEIETNPNIRYMGQQRDIRPYVMASDVLVLPSYREGLSTVLVEAGAMSMPAITCDVTGCNEIIEDGKNGLLIEPRNEDALYDAMEKMYTHRTRLPEIGKEARKLVAERYEESVVWNNYLTEFLKLKERLQ